jgi:hypothetical protein
VKLPNAKPLTSQKLSGVGAVTQQVISDVFVKLKDSAAVTPRLFFPNGIELIDVSVSVGLTAKGIEVKVKIAGEKGIGSLLIQDETEGEPADSDSAKPRN